MKPILVDTDVLIDYLRGHQSAVDLITGTDRIVMISSLSIAELYAGVKGDDEAKTLNDFIETLEVVPVTAALAKTAGSYRKKYLKSHNFGLADAVIAATVQQQGAVLMTLNVKHFPMLEGVRPAYGK